MPALRILPAGDAALARAAPRAHRPGAERLVRRLFARARDRPGHDRRRCRDRLLLGHGLFRPVERDAAWLEAEVRAYAGSLDVEDAAEGAWSTCRCATAAIWDPISADVAAFAGCSEAEVIDLHAGREYRVYMVGFVPGFAYMAEVEPRIAAPRRASPRTAVPAGSVAIAGGQTGVYPAVTPGGWNIIGRTALRAVPIRIAPSRSCSSPATACGFSPMAHQEFLRS